MKHCVKTVSFLSTAALLGCAQLSLAPPLGAPVATVAARTSVLPRVQPVENVPGTVSEVEGFFILGRAAHGAGDLAQAEERYMQVLSKQPSHLGALNSIAVIYAQTQRSDKAIEYFKRAIELDPQASHVHNNLGYALLLAGRLAEAGPELALAHDLNPSNSQPRQSLESLARSAEGAAAGPQIVAVAKNVYELRDGSALRPATTQAAATVAAAVKELAPGASLQGVRIEVSNGVGIRHLARRTAERLVPMGVVTARLTNQPRFRQPKTEIQFGVGQKDAADALSTQLPAGVRTVPSARLAKNIQMRLVLGHDQIGNAIAAWLESGSEIHVALAGHDVWRWS